MKTLATESRPAHLLEDVRRCLKLASEFSAQEVQEEGHWRGELRSNPSITAEYIMLLYALGESIPEPHLWTAWLLSEQHVDGSWALAPNIPGDISITVETYLALRILGVDHQYSALRKARDFALSSGGIARVRTSTRILLATFGLFPWTAVPELPPELILVSPSNPFSVCQMASWTRGTIIPLLLIRHHRPVFALPNGQSESNSFLDELWCNPDRKQVPYSPSLWKPWKTDPVSFLFTMVDNILHAVNGMRGLSWRANARRKCTSWILEHLDGRAWGNFFPPMHVGVLALVLEGYTLDSPPVRRGLESLKSLVWTGQSGNRIQPSLSPVRDTILMTIGLADSSSPGMVDINIQQSIEWIKSHQQLSRLEAENKIPDPSLRQGGFSFGVSAKSAPDVGDTAAAILAILKNNTGELDSSSVYLAIRWILGMQNRDGGWGAFDHENNKLFLNRTFFGDMDNNMCDPSTADVTGRVLEAFGYILRPPSSNPIAGKLSAVPRDLHKSIATASSRAVAYLLAQQTRHGNWYGRWGANYIYGTCAVLCGLSSLSASRICNPKESTRIQTAITAGIDWLISVQNADGGWGESLLSYRNPKRAGQGPSAPSQTAWALMGLLTGLPPMHVAVVRGVQYLVWTQKPMTGSAGEGGASWDGSIYTGTAFPNHLFLGYAFYSHYFPMMALGRYAFRVENPACESGSSSGDR
ncbi:hypothetical protein ARAM_003920 [Aspergillus rambellii]|uniref:Terpene cyclase/mutase family member n=1 Tax=Aspergillus rambellii TaxID=308745 RepID=A0A0F8X1H0_9EURO|nr:hypothetical protein ARAM_003920 [Aspergillus rambellii]